MKHLINTVKIAVNEKTYVKNPESSDLGKRIVQSGIALISEVGFENFNFRKLGARIGSNESSVYRYFENKHKFLIYLSSWYWGWKEYQLVLTTNNIQDPAYKLERALNVLTEPVEADSSFSYIDEAALYQIVINEYSKSFLTKEVDRENKEGYFEIYKRMVGQASGYDSGCKSGLSFSGKSRQHGPGRRHAPVFSQGTFPIPYRLRG